MPDSHVTEAATPSPATPSGESPRRFSGTVALAYALVLALVLLLDAGRATPMLERQAAAFDWPWLRPVAGALRSASEASGLAALANMESRMVAMLSRERRIGSVSVPAECRAAAASRSDADRDVEPAPAPPALSASDAPGTSAGSARCGTGVPLEAETALPQSPGGATGSGNALSEADAAGSASPVDAALSAFRDATGTPLREGADEAAPALSKSGHGKPRVLLVGDSMMMEGFGPVLQRALRKRPDLEVVREGKYSTGLSRLDYFDWGSRLAELVRRDAPDLVVICLGANDPQDIIDEGGKRHHVDSASWAEIYRRRAENLLRVATAGGARAIWVGLPIMSKEPYSTRIRRLSDLQKAACASYARPGVGLARFVDTLAALADEHGAYAAFAAGADGRAVRLRYKDKVHVTEEGGRRMARRVLPFIFATLGLPERLPEPRSASLAGGKISPPARAQKKTEHNP